ncbi:MAG: hypothetical protein BalsKO_06440 [Balneolaceae bacterium]
MQLDILHYSADLHPDISTKKITGTVEITYLLTGDQHEFYLDKGELEIINITGSNIKGFELVGNQLLIKLTTSSIDTNNVIIDYKGSPSKGLFFDRENNHAYTVYFTDHWMVNNFDISDKATIELRIKVDNGIECFSNGVLKNKKKSVSTLFIIGYRITKPLPIPLGLF